MLDSGYITILDSLIDIFAFIWDSLNEILLQLVETFGVWGLIFAMILQAIIAPIISEAVLTAAGFGFEKAYGPEGIFLALLGGIVGSLLGSIVAFYISRGVQKALRLKVVDVYATGKDENIEKDAKTKNSLLTRIANILARFIDEDSDYFLEIIEKHGFTFVLIGRLIPFIPFDAVSYGAGFTRIGFWNYFIPTVIGTIPRVFFYVLLGAGLVTWAETDLNMFFLILIAIASVIVLLYIGSMRLLKKKVKEQRSEN
ncbi:MAG: TVP38/TMEM64 family protein [Candidatus Hodarchaeales archaeon]